MRRVARPPLSRETLRFLRQRTRRVAHAADPVAEVGKLWRGNYLHNKAFNEIRRALHAMATPRARCLYCCDSAGTDIEHFWPKSRFPDRAFVWANYLWACSFCNSNQKRTQFPLDAQQQPLLLDPSVDDPTDHFVFLPTTGDFYPLTERGRETEAVFGLNDHESPRNLPLGRRKAFHRIQGLLVLYGLYKASQRHDEAEAQRDVLLDEPFAFLLLWFEDIARRSPGSLGDECLAALELNPEIHTWID